MQPPYKKKFTPKEAKPKIAKYCAYQERCHQEVRDKLYAFGLQPLEVEELICDLIQQDFLNEERFALAYVRGKFLYKKWGRNKIKKELQRRKISDYCIKKGMSEIDPNIYERELVLLLQKKVKSFKIIKGYQKHYKAAQYAISRGYESDYVWKMIKTHFTENNF